jgi:hypothetical protein
MRDRLQRHIDNLQDAKLHILLQRSGRAQVERRQQLGGSFGRQTVPLGDHHQRDSLRHEVAHPAQNTDSNVIVLRQGDQASRIDKADVPGGLAKDGHFARVRSQRFRILHVVVQPVRPGHNLIDHGFRFYRNSVDNVIDTDGLRDVVNEEEQQPDADQRQHHRAQDGGDWREGVRQRARRRQRRHAVQESAEEDPKRPLRHAVAGKADDDARRELHRCQGERHQQDGEHDRHHRHNGRGNPRQNDLRDLRVGVRGE